MLDKVATWFETRYSPVALAKDRQLPMGIWKFFFYFLRQFRTAFILRVIVVAFGAVADAMLPIFVGLIVGMLADTQPGNLLSSHWQTFLVMALFVLLRPVAFAFDQLVRNQAIVPNLVDLVRWQSHWHLVRQSWSFFQDDFAGRLANKVLQSGEAMEMSFNFTIDAVWYALVFVVVAITVLSQLDPVLLVPIAVWLILYGVLFKVCMPLVAKYSEQLAEARSVMTGRMVDSYTNIQTLKTFSTGGHEDRYVADSVMEHAIVFRRLMRVFSTMWSSLFLMNSGLVIAIAGLSLSRWDNGTLTAAAVATAIPFSLQIMNISGWILDVGSNIFRQVGTVKDSMDTVAQPITMLDGPGAPALRVSEGRIEFDRVTFNYWRGEQGSVIKDFSLKIAPGEKVGLVGRSGAGKSTLVNLALRLFDVHEGAVRIDGQDIRGVTQESLRAAVGYVSQDTSLLHRSVRENIKYGRRSASDEEMSRAAEQARVAEVIAGLADGNGRKAFDAHVGERGVKLSGGQRQRIAIARVMLKDAPILILDEATSALDSEVEAAIQENLYRLMEGKTVIAIAHRLSTIAAMDRLVVMDQGRIIEEGTHDELVAKKGLYAHLWQRQSGGFLLDAPIERELAAE
jgi:ATP-binding cassette subfamily B multidrug efflux pump